MFVCSSWQLGGQQVVQLDGTQDSSSDENDDDDEEEDNDDKDDEEPEDAVEEVCKLLCRTITLDCIIIVKLLHQ